MLCYLNRACIRTAHSDVLASFVHSIFVLCSDPSLLLTCCHRVCLSCSSCSAGDPWQDGHGGALRVHSGGRQGAESAVRVLPVAGRLAMFYADSMPHEVEESWRERHALTMWYYDKLERAEALDAAKIAGGANAAAEERERQEAQTLIRAMMAGDPAADPTAAECAALGARVNALSPAALQIVSSIVGAPSASHFQEAAARLTPSGLKKLRQDFSTMKA